MDLERIDDLETLRDLLRVSLKESERLKNELKAAHEQLRGKDPAKAEQLALKLAKVERQHAAALKALFGQKSERRPSDKKKGKARTPQTGHGPRRQLRLPVQPVLHQIADMNLQCKLCATRLTTWQDQFEESDEIDFVAPQVIIKRHKRQKYRCTCGGCIVTSPGPRKLFPKARYSINFALHVVLQKYRYHMPLARQVKAFSSMGLDVTTATLWDYLFAVYGLLEPVMSRLEEHLLQQPVMGIDETKWRLLKSEQRGKSATWWVWVRRVQNAVHYTLDERRTKAVALRLLKDYTGTIIADGYFAYESAAKANPELTLANCWSHARREVLPYEADPRGARVLRVIRRMYRLEAMAQKRGLSPPELLQWRQRKTRPLLEALFRWLHTLEIPSTFELKSALQYIVKREKGLTHFLSAPLVSPDNNATERVIRGVVLGRKNHGGSRSKDGIRVAGLFYSLIDSAILAGVEPGEYLEQAVAAALDKTTIPLPHELAIAEAPAPTAS